MVSPRDAIDRARAFAVAHMGAHALGAAAYATKAASLAPQAGPGAADQETTWQLGRLDEQTRAALARLPSLGEDRAGPLGAGLLTRGELGAAIRRIQERL
ncbi:putative immunity protein [Microbacterium sp. X-17]|uniref:putative immunity protein n=1 Tax=Microbacterium sp. X-17 TaxID=3144404 RepID=UPI0031F5C240